MIDTYNVYKIGKGSDDGGDFTVHECHYELPCKCHPETCCHSDGKIRKVKVYKKYKNGNEIELKNF